MTAIKLLRTMPSERILINHCQAKFRFQIGSDMGKSMAYILMSDSFSLCQSKCLTTFFHIFVIFIEKLEIVCHTVVSYFMAKFEKMSGNLTFDLENFGLEGP